MSLPNTSDSGIPISGLPLGVNLSSQEDGMFYGFVLSTFLSGITVVQAWTYATRNGGDRWLLRILVATLISLDLAATILTMVYIHHDYVANFGNLASMSRISPLIIVEVLLTSIIACLMESFFASRIYYLKRVHWVIPLFILVSAVTALISAAFGVVDGFRHPEEVALASKQFKIEIAANSGLTTLCDIAITVAQIWSLNTFKTGFNQRTDNMLRKLLEFTVTRGLLVTIIQGCILLTYLLQPTRFYWLAFHMVGGKVYVITLVVMLNSRSRLRETLRPGASVVNSSELVRRPTHPATSSFSVNDHYALKFYGDQSKVGISSNPYPSSHRNGLQIFREQVITTV